MLLGSYIKPWKASKWKHIILQYTNHIRTKLSTIPSTHVRIAEHSLLHKDDKNNNNNQKKRKEKKKKLTTRKKKFRDDLRKERGKEMV